MKCLAIGLLLSSRLASVTALAECQEDDQGKVLLQREFTRRDASWRSSDFSQSNLTGSSLEHPPNGPTSLGSIMIRDGSLAVEIVANGESSQPRVPDDFHFSYLHDVVGRDGVKVITLKRTPERFAKTAEQLAKAGILATSFPAIDLGSCEQWELRYGCIGGSSLDKGKCGDYGCAFKGEQAIAASHRRVLEDAKKRKEAWTAIVEDDMVPLVPERWSEAFKAAWNKLRKEAPEARFVRLSWCNIVSEDKDWTMDFADAGDFALTRSLDGLCTGAYMIHKDVIDEMLNLFPCCGPVDTCWSVYLNQQDEDGRAHGQKFVVSMELKQSRQKITEISTGDEWMGQHGVMYQDREGLGSTKGYDKALFAKYSE